MTLKLADADQVRGMVRERNEMLEVIKAAGKIVAKFIADGHHEKMAAPNFAVNVLAGIDRIIAKAEGRAE
jgi:uncharacterized protein (DUF1015 family)